MNCCLCKNEIPRNPITGWDAGNNAEPLVTGGRCCNDCDYGLVIPVRLAIATGALTYDRLDAMLKGEED